MSNNVALDLSNSKSFIHHGQWTPITKGVVSIGFTVASLAAITAVGIALIHYQIVPVPIQGLNALTNDTVFKILAISGSVSIIMTGIASRVTHTTRKKIQAMKEEMLADQTFQKQHQTFSNAVSKKKGLGVYYQEAQGSNVSTKDKTKPFHLFLVLTIKDATNNKQKVPVGSFEAHYFSHQCASEIAAIKKRLNKIGAEEI